ncbi:MAG: hypothetical protein JWM08_1201 [Candidatus Angelobacter sp.]|nr:hypothetical protein [Candidatus Angelobacter sp.]
MKRAIACMLASVLLFSLSIPCFADFQYTETTRITGGAAAGAMKFVGVFSKDARQVTQGTTATISFKGNKMRREDSLGQVEIIDMDGRRITQIDTRKKTYSTMTFDEMRARMEEARKKAAEQQAKRNKEQASQVKIVPKVTITPGTGSKRLLDYNAKEMKMRVDMEMTSDDPKAKGQSANMWVDSDSFIAPVKGYDEVKHFYQRMAKELNWIPGAMVGGNAQIAPAMIEFRKSATTLNGMPLFSLVSVGMSGQPGAPQQTSRDEQKQSGGNPLSNGIGGLFGKKKKKDDASPQGDKSGSTPSGTPGSLMDSATEVTSVSTNAVDPSLFQIPAGYKQVETKSAQ